MNTVILIIEPRRMDCAGHDCAAVHSSLAFDQVLLHYFN